jgi:hypothetical protein
VRPGDELNARDVSFGSVAAIDPVQRTVDIKKTKKTADLHPAFGENTRRTS